MQPSTAIHRVKGKILVYLFGSLGDSLVAIPALRAIRRHFDSAEIVILQNNDAKNIVKASEVIPAELADRYLSYNSLQNKFYNFLKLSSLIRREHFDAAVFLGLSERPGKAVRRDRFFFRFSGVRNLYGFHALTDEELYPKEADGHPAATDHEAVRKLKRLARDGIDFDQSDLRAPFLKLDRHAGARIKEWLSDKRSKPHTPLISLAPGSKSQATAWPLDRFIEIGRRLLAAKDCELVVVGGPADREQGDQMIASWGGGINAAGVFSVEDSGLLLSECDLHIGVDTGTMHLAAAAGTRCFILFGERANPGQWYPLGDGHLILSHRVICAGCRTQTCPIEAHPCMGEITVDAAWQALSEFIDLQAPGSETRVMWV